MYIRRVEIQRLNQETLDSEERLDNEGKSREIPKGSTTELDDSLNKGDGGN